MRVNSVWVRSLLAVAVGLSVSGGTLAADTLLIRSAKVFDSEKARPVMSDVLVQDGRIAAVGTGLSAPEDATIVEAKGMALVPGLFDVHTHWTPAMTPSSSAQVSNAYLASGITVVGDYHQAPEAWAPRRQWLSQLQAPRVLFAARISTPLGHGADWADQSTTRWVNSPESARAAVRGLLPYRPDLIKVFTDGWRYGRSPDNTSMDGWTLAALVDEAHQHGLKIATHTVTVERAKVAAKAGVDIIAHSILDQPVDQELIALMRKHATAYAPTLAVYEPVRLGDKAPTAEQREAIALRERNYAQAVKNLKTLHRAGIRIVLGTDAGMVGTPHGRSSLHELELMVKAGIRPAEALRIGTLESARALALDADSGSITVGKRADFVLVEGHPWRDVSDMQRIRHVYLHGVKVVDSAQHADVATAPNAEQWPAALTVPVWIDDMEAADGRTTLGTLRTGEADAGNDRSWQVMQRVPRASGGHALQVTATLSGKTTPNANVVFPLAQGSVYPVNVSGYQGVEIEVRGTVRALALQMRGLEQRIWQLPVPIAGTEWQTIRLPFAQAVASDWSGKAKANAAAWKGEPLRELVLIGQGETGGQLWYEVDNLRFYP